MSILALIIIIVLQAGIIYLLIVSDKFRLMCREILLSIRKAMHKEKKEIISQKSEHKDY
jgi:hypothetical protein